MKTVNIEQGRPNVEQAHSRLSQEIRIAKANRLKSLKIIHGYGSSGKGGAIKQDTLRFLEMKKREGMIRHYCVGENFHPLTLDGRTAVELCPDVKNDRDYGRQNDGITVVIF